MSILISWLGPLRAICMAIDGIVFRLLDNAYMLVIKLSTAELFQHETIRSITNNLYILFGVVAFFRLALVLVNAIIDPEKLNEKGKGISNIFFRVVGMIMLLAVTPFLFQMSYDLQKRIVGADPEQNLIFKTILGDNANISGENAGKALQNIALSSLITIDKNYLKADGKVCEFKENDDGTIDYNTIINENDCGFLPLTCIPNGDDSCTNQGGYIFGGECTWDNCQKAVSKYNEMYVNEDMSPFKLSGSAGVSKKIEIDGEKEEVYVYNYMFIITGFVGGFMTYIIISFAIDIAVRMFELFVLEVLSPLFIATFVDPKSAQSGPFKNWLSAVGKSYANLYIKLAILALMILLVALINQSKIFTAMSDLGGWVKIFAVIGLLIFAKKAPKWIMDMIGVDNSGTGLWNPKKLKENMAGVGLVKAARTVAGAGIAYGAARTAIRKENKARKQKANDAIAAKERELGRNATHKEKQAIRKANGSTYTRMAMRNLNGLGMLSQGANAGKESKNIIGTIKAASDVSAKFKKEHSLDGQGFIGKGVDWAKGRVKKMDNMAWGTGKERFDKGKDIKDQENFENIYTEAARKGLTNKNSPVKQTAFDAEYMGLRSEDGFYAAEAAKRQLLSLGCSADPDKLKVSIDSNGIATVSGVMPDGTVRSINASDENKDLVKEGKTLVTQEGAAFVSDAFTGMREKALNNMINANQNIASLAASKSSASSQAKESADALAEAFNKIGISVDISSKSAKKIGENMSEALGKNGKTLTEEEQQKIGFLAQKYENDSAVETNIGDQMNQYLDSIKDCKSAIEALIKSKPEKYGGKTYDELLVIIQHEKEDTAKILEDSKVTSKKSSDGKTE